MKRITCFWEYLVVGCLATACLATSAPAGSAPIHAATGMVVSQNAEASAIGVQVLRDGGTAVDAVVATAFALAVNHPTAGNIGGGGFLIFRAADGDARAYDFRELAPAAATETMWLVDGQYDPDRHHEGYLSVGVPGTVAGLHLAWREQGKLPWARLLQPAIAMAQDGFPVTYELAASLREVLPRMQPYPASISQFTNGGQPLRPGDILRQPDLAKTLRRIAEQGPDGFYRGPTADRIVQEMRARNGLITHSDLADYTPRKRSPVRGSYRGHEVISMPPPSSGGTALIEMLNILEGYDLAQAGFGSAQALHWYIEAMRRAYADRARYLGDPDWNPDMPVQRLISKPYAAQLRKTISTDRASTSDPTRFEWPAESSETTHVSVVDADRNAVALTYTLEYAYGSGIVVPGAGFLLNNEMGDFNPAPGLTTRDGLIGTPPNLTAPGKRMLSSMTPTIVTRDGHVVMVTGSPGGRTIINTVLQTIVNVIDFGMNAQEAVDAARVHHQWLPDTVYFEHQGFSPDTLELLRQRGHQLAERERQGAAQVIVVDPLSQLLSGGNDRRVADGAAVGY